MRSLICFAVKLPPRIFSYKPHSIPSANNLPPGLTGQQSPAAPSFFTEQISAFCLRQPSVKAPSAPVSILWLPTFRFLFLFLSFCSLFFCFFLATFHFAPSSFNIPNFYFFRIFLRISARKNSIHYWML